MQFQAVILIFSKYCRQNRTKQKKPIWARKIKNKQVLAFIKNENLHFGDVANWIKQNYQEKNTIITNSKQNKTKKENRWWNRKKLLNSLEDKNKSYQSHFYGW